MAIIEKMNTRCVARQKLFEYTKTDLHLNYQDIKELLIMLTEILDDHLEQKIRSDKVIEDLLKDIRGEIDRGGERIENAIDRHRTGE